MTRIRLVQVVVQPVLVAEDDDGNLSPLPVEPVTIAAKDWPTYPTTGFKQALETLEATLDQPDDE